MIIKSLIKLNSPMKMILYSSPNAQLTYTLWRISILSLIFALWSCNQKLGSMEQTSLQLEGIWIREDSSGKNYILLKKSDKFKDNTSCYHFQSDGTIVIQEPLGDQLLPNYISYRGKWRLLSSNIVEIDRLYPGESPDKMKILKLRNREMRFLWE